jgi:hypothetical protein
VGISESCRKKKKLRFIGKMALDFAVITKPVQLTRQEVRLQLQVVPENDLAATSFPQSIFESRCDFRCLKEVATKTK